MKSMKSALRRVAAAGVGLAVLVLTTAASGPEGRRNGAVPPDAQTAEENYDLKLRIHNDTAWTMVEFYAQTEDDSGPNLLGDRQVPSGGSAEVTIKDGGELCVYDFLFVFPDDRIRERYAVNVCQIEEFRVD